MRIEILIDRSTMEIEIDRFQNGLQAYENRDLNTGKNMDFDTKKSDFFS